MQVDEKIENKLIAKEYKNLLRSSYRSLSEKDKKLIRIAFDTSVDAHKNQRRKSGEAYVFHPIGVAKIVASQIGLDAISISAALLHDVIEDTKYKLEDIEKVFVNKVSRIVEGLTKISNLELNDRQLEEKLSLKETIDILKKEINEIENKSSINNN